MEDGAICEGAGVVLLEVPVLQLENFAALDAAKSGETNED